MYTNYKIKSLDELANALDELRKSGKKIVQCHGVFDLIHPGHIRHLRAAKQQGDVLVVSLTKDAYVRKGPGRPVFNEYLRAETIAALAMVDYICLVDDFTAVDCIRRLRPHVYAKGQEYDDPALDLTGRIVDEAAAVREVGGTIFLTEDIAFSSSNLLNTFSNVLSPEQKSCLQEIKHKYSRDRILKAIEDARKLRVMIIGDTIIDEYVYCEPLGQSLKNPLVVHKYITEERFCGGAVVVANQVAQFCDEVHLVTVVGERNSYQDYIQSSLAQNVAPHFFRRADVPTVVKRRYVYENVEQKVFEVCVIDDLEPPEELESEMAEYVKKNAPNFDLVMISDYGHGVLTHRIVSDAQRGAQFLAVNAQTNSANLGYNLITKKYSSIDFACIDEPEARLARQDRHKEIEEIGKDLMDQLAADRLIITRGKKGSVGIDRAQGVCYTPAFATQVVDRVGAGDAFFAIAAPCSALRLPLDLVSFIGNAMGALAVQIVGNREVTSSTDLLKFIVTLLK